MFGMKNAEVGITMMQAHDIAEELGHAEVGPDHILLGLSANLRGIAQRLLAEHGLTYAAAREIVIAQHGTRPSGSTKGGSPGDVTFEDDREALASIGIDLDKVTEAVGSAFGEDITRAWGRRRDREQREDPPAESAPFPNAEWFPRDFPNAEWFPPFGGPRGRGRRGPQSRRFGRGPQLSEATISIFKELRTEVRDAMQGMDVRHAGWPQIQQTFRPERLVLAILDSADPATQALVRTMSDVPGLRTTLRERLAASTAAA